MKDSELILSDLADVPRLEWLEEAKTDDQKQHWETCKIYYLAIWAELNSYFNGLESPLNLDDPFQKTAVLRAKTLIALYGSIRENWRKLKPLLKIRFSNNETYFPEQPGEVILMILKVDAREDFETCLSPYFEFSPRRLYKIYQQVPKEVKVQKLKQKIQKERGESLEYYLVRMLRGLKVNLSHYQKEREKAHSFVRSSLHPRKRVKGYKWVKGEKLNLS